MPSSSRSLLLMVLIALGVFGPLLVTVQRERALSKSPLLTEGERCRRATLWNFFDETSDQELCKESMTSGQEVESRWEGLSGSRSWLWANERVTEYERLADDRLSTLPVTERSRRSWVLYRGAPWVALSFVAWVCLFLLYLCRREGRGRLALPVIGSLVMAIWLALLWWGVS